MNFLARFFVIAFGFFAACFVASAIILMTWLLPEIFDVAPPINNSGVSVLLAAGTLAVSGLALIPALMLIAVAEMFSIRSALIYALSGAVAALSAYLSLIDLDTAREVFGTAVRRHLEIMTGAGIAGGFVYWLIAGRNAGLWRESAVPPAAPPSVPR